MTTPANSFLSQQEVWNNRSANWNNWGFNEPLSPSSFDLELQERCIVPGGKTLVLGATPGLCKIALKQTQLVTSVDFAPDAIKTFQIENVKYVCQDWITFLQDDDTQYDNIVTDNGFCCVAFPNEWQLLIKAIYGSLKPGGTFSMRAFVATDSPMKQHYDNPNLQRIIPGMSKASAQNNWTVVKPADGITNFLPARYTFASSEVIEELFADFSLIQKITPPYEEGERFVSFAFQRPV